MRFVGIDPSTKTGFTAIASNGAVVRAKEITGISDKDPQRMSTMIDNVIDHVQQGDIIAIEGFGFASQQGVQNGGIGWGIRMALFKKGIRYYEVAPNSVKKFVNVTGWEGERGNKRRLEGTEKKQAIMKAVKEHYGFIHSSDNVVDAYILAQIAKSMHTKKVKYPHQISVVKNLKLA